MGNKVRHPELYVDDIISSIKKVKTYTKKMSFQEFSKNNLVQDAVARNFEIIGEAARQMPKQVKDKNKNIEWQQVIAFRNIIAHEYFGISYKIMWDIIQNELPPLLTKIKKIAI